MWEALQFEFMRNALIAGILVSIICGVLGTLVVVNRIVFISGGIAHAAYGGIGLGLYLGISPYLGAVFFSVVVSIVMGIASVKVKERADTIIGVMWAIGMALGIIFVELTPGYNVDLMSYLFGSILSVPRADIWYMVCLVVVVLGTVFFFYKEFVALSYDEEFSFVVGILLRPPCIDLAFCDRDHPRGGPHPGHCAFDDPSLYRGKIHVFAQQNDGSVIPAGHLVHLGRPLSFLLFQPGFRSHDHHGRRDRLLCLIGLQCRHRAIEPSKAGLKKIIAS